MVKIFKKLFIGMMAFALWLGIFNVNIIQAAQLTATEISQIKTTEASIDGFTVRMYRLALKREADAAGFNYWSTGLRSGKETGTSIVKGFFNSNEFKKKPTSDSYFLNTVYSVVLNRQPDPTGMQHWSNRLRVGMTREHVLTQIINSNEFTNLCNHYGIRKGNNTDTGNYRDRKYEVTAFVYRMYTTALQRGADTYGLEDWSKRLHTGNATGATLVEGFMLSQELEKKNLSDADFIRRTYLAVLDRKAEESEVAHWVGIMHSGKNKREILSMIVDSQEFANLCARYGIQKGRIVIEQPKPDPIQMLNAPVSPWVLTGINGYNPSPYVFNQVYSAIKYIESIGGPISMVMMDLNNGQGLMYNPDQVIYSASSVKAPYIVSVVESNPAALAADYSVIEGMMHNSNNESYAYLTGKYGMGSFKKFYDDIGVPFTIDYPNNIYTWYSGRTYAKLWARMYKAFNTNAACEQIGQFLSRNLFTSARHALPQYQVRSKTGWIATPLRAQNECGVVYAKSNYVYVLLTEYAGNWETFHPVYRALELAHREIEG
ncbi:MAG: DUF4214 domain-containing protein [Solobacterium sp.]|nr:DUF4214 domain-containing protein [Solobacterium sp.]